MKHLCIFCNKRVDSAEDAWPTWLRKFVDKPGRGKLLVSLGEGDDETTAVRHGSEVRIKCVCQGCNNGWMERLERKVRPVFVRLASSNAPYTITYTQAETLAAWTTKTAMVFEYHARQKDAREFTTGARFFTTDQRRHFKTHLLPPSNATIWIGYFSPRNTIYTCPRGMYATGKGGLVGEAATFTFAFAHLALQLLALRVTPKDDLTRMVLDTNDVYRDKLLRLWKTSPDATISWPPFSVFPDIDSLDKLAHRFTAIRLR